MGGLGLATAGAAGMTAAGSWWLFASPSPLLRVDGRLAVLGVLWSLAWFVVILTVILRSQRQAPMGTEALVGTRGVVRSMLNPGGIVVVDGADVAGPAGQRRGQPRHRPAHPGRVGGGGHPPGRARDPRPSAPRAAEAAGQPPSPSRPAGTSRAMSTEGADDSSVDLRVRQ